MHLTQCGLAETYTSVIRRVWHLAPYPVVWPQ